MVQRSLPKVILGASQLVASKLRHKECPDDIDWVPYCTQSFAISFYSIQSIITVISHLGL